MPRNLSLTLLVTFTLSVASALLTAVNIENGDFTKIDQNAITAWTTHGDITRLKAEGLPQTEYCLLLKAATEERPGSNVSQRERNARSARLSQHLNDFKINELLTVTFYAKSEEPGHSLVCAFSQRNAKDEKNIYSGKEFQLSRNWKKYSYSYAFPSEKWSAGACRLYFANLYGKAFLADVTLSTAKTVNLGGISKEATGVKWTANRKNILINPGFDLKWQGWMPYAVPNDMKPSPPITFDSTIKRSGEYSIKLPPYNGLISLRYNMNPNDIYTLSFYVRGEKDIANLPKGKQPVFTLCHHSRGKAAKIFLTELSTNWKRYSFSARGKDIMNPNMKGKNNPRSEKGSFFFRVLNYSQPIWIDCVQLEKGELTPFHPNIDIGYETNKKNAIYFPYDQGEAKAIIYHQGGFEKTASFNVSVSNIYAETIQEKEYSVTPTKDDFSTIPISFPSELGVIDIESILRVDGTEISQGKWRCLRVNEPETFKNPMIGFYNNIGYRYPSWLIAKRLDFLEILGGTMVTLDGVQKNADYMAMLKHAADECHKRGMKTATKVTFPVGHKLHGLTYRNPKTPFFTEPTPEEDIAFANEFADMIMERHRFYGDSIDKIYLMNEPNLSRDKNGKRVKPSSRVAKIYQVVRERVNKEEKGVYLAGSINAIDIDYVNGLTKNGAFKHVNELGVHPYRATAEAPSVYHDLLKTRELLKKAGHNIDIVNSEQYFAQRTPYNQYGEFGADYATSSEAEHAARTVQVFLHDLAAGVSTQFFHPWGTLVVYGGVNPVYYFYAFGALRAASELLNGVTQGTLIEADNNLRVFLFVKPDHTKIVSMNTIKNDKSGFMTLPDNIDRAVDINGNKIDSDKITLSYLPSYLIFRPETAVKDVIASVKGAKYSGLAMPLDITFALNKQNDKLNIKLTNPCGRNLDGKLYLRLPDKRTLNVNFALKPGESTLISETFSRNSFNWCDNIKLSYSIDCEDSVYNGEFKLPTIYAAKASNITIDGNLSDWNNAQWMTVDKTRMIKPDKPIQVYNGPDDFTADAAIKWDDDNVYIAVKVTDDQKDFGAGNPGVFYRFDSLQLYFDQSNDAMPGRVYDEDDAVYQIGVDPSGKPVAWLEKAPTGRYVGWANMTTGFDGDVRVGQQQTDNGYTWEIAIPKSALTFTKFQEGTITSFALTIHDKDQKAHKSFSLGPQETNFKNPNVWKSVKLSD